MTDYARTLSLTSLLPKKSFFLLGPRSTGKSYLIRKELAGKAVMIDLLKSDLFLRLSARPWELQDIIQGGLHQASERWVVIDEIQKIPGLLDEVHRLIETEHLRFLLTGSSARKLRHGHSNLLAGRARSAELFPLTYHEISNFKLEHYLRYGGLPMVHQSSEPEEDLHAYTQTYLQEEIQTEGLVRKLPAFSRFLQTAALCNGHILNFSKLASDTAIPASTIRDYYNILIDTLLGFYVEPFTQTQTRKAITTKKFYFFDSGVTHTLAGTRTLERNSDLYGKSFEHFIATELRAYISYTRNKHALSYWRTTHQHEVDFILGDRIALEIKASKSITMRDAKGLTLLMQEKPCAHAIVVSQDKTETQSGSIRTLHWKTFLEALWNGAFEQTQA